MSCVRVGSFIEGAQHITLAYAMNHFVIEVRAENIDLSHHSCVFDGLQDRNSISCTDIETFHLRMLFEECERLFIGLGRGLMVFDPTVYPDTSILHLDCALKGLELLFVIGNF